MAIWPKFLTRKAIAQQPLRDCEYTVAHHHSNTGFVINHCKVEDGRVKSSPEFYTPPEDFKWGYKYPECDAFNEFKTPGLVAYGLLADGTDITK